LLETIGMKIATLRADRFSLIEQWMASGMSKRTFCEQQGVSYYTFQYWYRMYTAKQPVNGQLLPVTLTDSSTSNSECIRLKGAQGIEVELPLTERSIHLLKALLS
jgi:hypothetical protein